MTHLATYVGLLHHSEQTLADSLRTVGQGHSQEADVFHLCETLARMSDDHIRSLTPIARRYGEKRSGQDVEEPERLHAEGIGSVREGAVGLVRDLQDLCLLATLVQTSWTVVNQAAQGARDQELLKLAQQATNQTSRQLTWLNTRMKAAAPQALLVAP
ncbi:hypothetical protein [Streptomyces badius]|uniref:Molybdopterin oxidoreductase n=1 Tax=Streptomyces badius TaxID=1941 RepID=A0ABQ2TPC8_STRBA|nr:hypothetical protein [Streptomyces badius]GGS81463.1 hypothetical protein GCM10010253_65160 [Streptomyces badius]